MDLKDLAQKGLDGFQIREITEVYRVGDDGLKTCSAGFFQDANIAKAFAQNQRDAAWYQTTPIWVLTDGKIAVPLTLIVQLSSDEQVEHEIRKKALAKLSLEERKVLGL